MRIPEDDRLTSVPVRHCTEHCATTHLIIQFLSISIKKCFCFAFFSLLSFRYRTHSSDPNSLSMATKALTDRELRAQALSALSLSSLERSLNVCFGSDLLFYLFLDFRLSRVKTIFHLSLNIIINVFSNK